MSRKIQDLFNLSGRVAMVTGGATGLGYQMAEALAEAGAAVGLASRREELCRSRAQDLSRSTGARTAGLQLDVTAKEDVARCFNDVEKTLGAVDIAVINAGISGLGAGLDLPEQDW